LPYAVRTRMHDATEGNGSPRGLGCGRCPEPLRQDARLRVGLAGGLPIGAQSREVAGHLRVVIVVFFAKSANCVTARSGAHRSPVRQSPCPDTTAHQKPTGRFPFAQVGKSITRRRTVLGNRPGDGVALGPHAAGKSAGGQASSPTLHQGTKNISV